jgi:hypothetical protein
MSGPSSDLSTQCVLEVNRTQALSGRNLKDPRILLHRDHLAPGNKSRKMVHVQAWSAWFTGSVRTSRSSNAPEFPQACAPSAADPIV